MPELPEVETIVCQLRPLLVGQRLLDLQIHDRERLVSAAALPHDKLPIRRKIETLSRFGKYIIISFSRLGRSDLTRPYLVIHLRMTGRLFWKKSEDKVQPKSLRARLVLSNGFLEFCDVRRFGTFEFCENVHGHGESGAVSKQRLLCRDSVDPLSDEFSLEWLQERASQSKQQAKSWLMRQDRLVGVGNIYASEALFLAGIHPQRLMCNLSREECASLRKSLRRILCRAIKNGGTTFSDFQDSRGETGRHQHFLKVYNREGEPCRTCKSPISRGHWGGRSTYYCLRCQPLY